jgi:hypothetical protein
VRLLRGLGHCRGRGNIVALWPDQARQRQQPPLLLRLAEFRGGRQTVWLVTNVLDRRQLSTSQMRTIYRQRWGVELFFRGLKQTFGRSKLRSQSPRNAEVELDWSLAALWSLELLAKRELLQRGAGPHDLSLAGALRAIRVALQCASQGVETELFSQLAAHRDDGYVRRHKAIRKWPKRKSEPRIRPPQGVVASQEQVEDSKRLPSHAVSKSFTA